MDGQPPGILFSMSASKWLITIRSCGTLRRDAASAPELERYA